MIKNAQDLVNAEGFGTLANLGRKINNHKPICEECVIEIGLHPTDDTSSPLWNDDKDAENESSLKQSWKSVEILACLDDGEETDHIVLPFPFEYDEFMQAIDTVQQIANIIIS